MLAIGLLFACIAAVTAQPARTEPPRLYTNQSYVEDVTRAPDFDVTDKKAVFAFVLGSLPERVKVYPTENYYYFVFFHQGMRYAGNIRLENTTRDLGKVHFAYSIDFTEWKEQDRVFYTVFDATQGITVEKLDRLVYRIAFGPKSVIFELNDLSGIRPPDGMLGADERFIGPIFDESAIRFFLVYNQKLKLFHYVLDESAPVPEDFVASRLTDRLLIGKRTGFAFYRDHKRERKILVGVFESNARVNSYFDGPFDQLPDNFIEGESLRSALLEVAPELRGTIDRFGSSFDGESRYMIAPYAHYTTEDDLAVFHQCATSRRIAAELYPACFVLDEGAPARMSEAGGLRKKTPNVKKSGRANGATRKN
jgi:hypothetical protein